MNHADPKVLAQLVSEKYGLDYKPVTTNRPSNYEFQLISKTGIPICQILCYLGQDEFWHFGKVTHMIDLNELYEIEDKEVVFGLLGKMT